MFACHFVCVIVCVIVRVLFKSVWIVLITGYNPRNFEVITAGLWSERLKSAKQRVTS